MVHDDRHALESGGFLFPALHRRLPALLKRGRARLVYVGIGVIELHQPLGDHLGNSGDVARIEMNADCPKDGYRRARDRGLSEFRA